VRTRNRTLAERLKGDICRCGHRLAQHDYGAIYVYRVCNVRDCPCMRYKFKETKMNPGQERIVCAAIWFNDGASRSHQATNSGYILCGLRHCNIWTQPGANKLLPHESGFLTNRGTFVRRKPALRIARAAGQLEGREKHPPLDQLLSEDLY
jgi:hypothetical protein